MNDLRSLASWFASVTLTLSAVAHADAPEDEAPRSGCVRPEPEAYHPKDTVFVGQRLILTREVRWVKGLGSRETNTLDLDSGELWEGSHRPPPMGPGRDPETSHTTVPPLVFTKQNGWTLDWVRTGKPVVKEHASAWSINASRTHLLLLTAEGDGHGFYVFDVKTRKRLRRETWPRGAGFERLPDGEHYLFHGKGRATLTDALGVRIADWGDEPAYDTLTEVDAVRIASVNLASHHGQPLVRLLHPRCDAVIVQSLTSGEIVRREDLRGLRASPEATGEGCLAFGDDAGRLIVVPGRGALDVVGRLDLSAEPALRTWRLPTCAAVP